MNTGKARNVTIAIVLLMAIGANWARADEFDEASAASVIEGMCSAQASTFKQCFGMSRQDCMAAMATVMDACAEAAQELVPSSGSDEGHREVEECINRQLQRHLSALGYDMDAECELDR